MALVFEIARGNLPVEEAVALTNKLPVYLGRLVDLPFASGAPGGNAEEARALDAALQLEALTLCRAAGESQGRGLADVAAFRARDLYTMLAYGRAEAGDPVCGVAYDRLLGPKLRSAGTAMAKLLDESGGVGLRQFAAGALDAHRLDAFLALVGRMRRRDWHGHRRRGESGGGGGRDGGPDRGDAGSTAAGEVGRDCAGGVCTGLGGRG